MRNFSPLESMWAKEFNNPYACKPTDISSLMPTLEMFWNKLTMKDITFVVGPDAHPLSVKHIAIPFSHL